jgi:hypothetical protein
VWAALSEAIPDTCLIPLLALTLGGDKRRPWQDGATAHFEYPADLAEVDRIDPAVVLRAGWPDRARLEEEDADAVASVAGMIASFSWQLPGLAPACEEPMDPAALRDVLESLPPSRIGLAAAGRPADALPAMGWTPGNRATGVLRVAAVLRSWEDRFGARLLAVGLDEFKLLAGRPPRDLAAAQHVAAEIFALGADEFSSPAADEALRDVQQIATCLLRSPVWGLWD